MQINSINNNSNPNFGMALKPFKTEGATREVLDIFAMASKGLKKTAEDVNLDVTHLSLDIDGNCYIDVAASTLQKNVFQKLFKKPEEFVKSLVINYSEGLTTVPQFAAKLEEVGQGARQKYFDESIEIGKRNLKKAMKQDSTSEKKYPPYVGEKLASIKPPENIVKNKTNELQESEQRTGPLPFWQGKRK